MMKLIQFLSPSRPVVVYCQFHEASTRREGGRDIPYSISMYSLCVEVRGIDY